MSAKKKIKKNKPSETWAWLVAPAPNQVEKLVEYKTTFGNKILSTTFKEGEKLTETQLAKKNCLMLVLQGLQLTKDIEETIHAIKELMGPKNVSSHYFRSQHGLLHGTSVNIECLNPKVYHHFINKTHKIFNTHITFTPHPKSLKPTQEEEESFGFCGINSTLVYTLEAI